MKHAISKRKKLILGLCTTVLFFVVLEICLTLLGVSLNPVLPDPYIDFEPGIPLFEENAPGGRGAPEEAPVQMRTHSQKLTYFNQQSFSIQKPPDTFRIFCVGGSTTYGRPYDDLTSFPGWLRELLPVADTSKNWEVINAGGISYASYRVTTVMEELSRYEPDLFIVYCGHNEFLEERTYREIKQLPKPLWKADSLLSRTRTYSSFKHFLRPRNNHADRLSGEVDALLDHTIGPELYHRNDYLKKQIVDHYAHNLNRMIAIAQNANATILFIRPTSNLKDASPFKSELSQDLSRQDAKRWHQLYQKATELNQDDHPEEALQAYQQAARIDSRYAELHYRMGKILFQLKRYDEARTSFQRARDEDVCPLRALTEMSVVFETLEEHPNVFVLDFENQLIKTCRMSHGHSIPGQEYFFDHVHPTIETNRMLAEAIVEQLEQSSVLQRSPTWSKESVHKVANSIENQIDQTAHAGALKNLAKVLTWAGKHDEAGPPALKALQTIPDAPECLFMAGTWFRKQGKIEQSFAYFSRALENVPDAADLHLELARQAERDDQPEQARLHFEEVLRLRPEEMDAQEGLRMNK